MHKKWIALDIESTGAVPGRYSMISIGACVVRDSGSCFYREIKPVNKNYDYESMKVAAGGLICIRDYKNSDNELDPNNRKFKPSKVLEVLHEKGEEPSKVMKNYAEWIIKNTYKKGFKPVHVSYPIKMDGSFVDHYLHEFYYKHHNHNPNFPKEIRILGVNGCEDLNSIFRGITGDIYAHIDQVQTTDERNPRHNALEDAKHCAKKCDLILGMMEERLGRRQITIENCIDSAQVVRNGSISSVVNG